MSLPIQVKAYLEMVKKLVPILTLDCPKCDAQATVSGNVKGRKFFYIHEEDGKHTVKILRVN